MAINQIKTWTGNFSNISSPEDWITQMNTNLNQMLGISIIVAVFIVTLFLLHNVSDFKKAFLAASFTSALLTWLFWIINWVSTQWLIIFIIATLIGLVAVYKSQE